MKAYLDALCWAGAMLLVATAGVLGWINEASMTTLLIALPAVMFATMSGRTCPLIRRGARS